ncbi:secretory pathway protein Sec39-domain-containing protein [Lentinula raphanica]|nr:secretory pathway protein Sec39-domain-containing protein [Lentinula raphanica]
MPSSAYTRWTELNDEQLTVNNVQVVLKAISDDVWVSVACTDRLLDDLSVQRAILDVGIERSHPATERVRNLLPPEGLTEEHASSETLIEYFKTMPADTQLCHFRAILLKRLDRMNTFVEISKELPSIPVGEDEEAVDEDPEWEDDPWAETNADPVHPRSATCFSALRILFLRYGTYLWPYRFTILEHIPAYANPTDYHFLLPSCDSLTNIERQTDIIDSRQCSPSPEVEVDPLDTAEQLSNCIDVVLSFIQHGASQNVPHLDELGEDLSLLSKLVYDAPHGPESTEDWTLTQWRAMDPPAIIRAYLKYSTPLSLPHDITHLVMPYLFVLESRVERAGRPDPQLSNRLLHQYILEAPLDMALSVFEASKPTLPVAQRIIKQEDDMVRLALACLYGSDSLREWSTMSAIFECLPVWEISADDNEEDAADTTITSLGAFVTPSTSRPKTTPSDLLVFFTPLPLSSLSRALDILDVHLESGEILARWSVPAPLRRNNFISEQRAWANRMARRAGGNEDELTTQEDWEWLLEDITLDLFSWDEIFEIAKILLKKTTQFEFDSETLEDICIACSHEFYDNAGSGNYKFGEMKLAYDCLDVPPLSDRLLKEREFIEATSRLSSFNIMSHPGIPITPIEIRLTKDRLSLVSRVLSSNADAYKHTEVILDLVYKLGFRDDIVAEVKALAMLADTALQVEDFDRAYETSQRMIDTVLNLRATLMGIDDPRLSETSEVCWVACFQLGRQPEFHDVDKKMLLLGRAIEICPPDRLHDVLTAWRRLEREDLEIRQERLETSHNGTVKSVQPKNTKSLPKTTASSLQARLRDFHMPSPPLLSTPDARALASKTFNTVAANFPFSVGQRGRSQFSQLSQGDERSRSGSRRRADGGDVQTQASRVFSKGIGWLIGAEEDL